MINKEAELAEEYAIHTDQTFFLTGKAGTGKTTLLKKIIEKSSKNIAVVAPTGVAAINAGGSTIHSMFGFPLKIYVPTFDRVDINNATNKALLKNHLRYRTDKRKVIQALELLIIDEISMVRADTLDAIDYALKYTRKNQLPFGGVQVIVIGDLFQLSPIARNHDWDILRQYYPSPYFFHAKVWNETRPLLIELKKVYRQEEENFIHLLNAIRNGNPTSDVLDQLNEQYDPDFTTKNNESIILTTHNNKANDINLKALNSLDSRAHKFKAEVDGNFADSAFPIDEILTLKEGAQVMFIRNDTEEGAYFNGKLAKVEHIGREDIKVRFLDDDRTYFIDKVKWENKVYSIDKETNEVTQEVVGSFKQYPIRLAWAITIHKSQGLTFDKAVIDIGDAFAIGQTYVALSRCTNLEGMTLKSKVNPKSVRVNGEVQAFYQSAPSIQEIESGLKEAKHLYSRRKLRATFSFGYLKDDINDWISVLEKKTIPDKAKAVDLSLQLNKIQKNLDRISQSFQFQLDKLFQDYDASGDPSELLERITKAIEYFTNDTFEKLIKPTHEHLAAYSLKKGTKAYNEAVSDLLEIFWGRLNTLYALDFLGEKIWKGKQISQDDLPPIPSAKKVKGEKADTFAITLGLYEDGKSVKEIAKLRSMAATTIEGHMARWVEKGKIEITKFVKPARLKKILPFIDKNESKSLTELIKEIPFDTTFGELKLVIAYSKSPKMASK
ncbi:helix-turn-helix domain-containing protein [Portibacter lacus]|uniref:Helicase n=1 Tax=Portibacter lacus TaxID=1099794 RepID=A0AA37WFD7_9BACT|nr:helix-turn-helix domain-containing protein [Portibacter lacus]GLR18477.1 helicase [Portibacter lacus]